MPPTTGGDEPPCARVRPRGASQTGAAILDALFALTAERRYATIRVADLLARARVGKSTFYDHFDGKDDALAAAMRPILLALATAASGRAARSSVHAVVAHLWERRAVARPILDSTAARIVERRLAEAIAAHGSAPGTDVPLPLDAIGSAAAQVAMLRAWLAGRTGATVDAMTDRLIACARLRDGEDIGRGSHRAMVTQRRAGTTVDASPGQHAVVRTPPSPRTGSGVHHAANAADSGSDRTDRCTVDRRTSPE